MVALAADQLTPQQQLQRLLQQAQAANQKNAVAPAANPATAQVAANSPTSGAIEPAANPNPNQTPSAPAAPARTGAPMGGGAVVPGVDTGADLRDEAFAGMANTALPMTPDQIRTLHSLYDETQRAATEFPGVPPRPTSSSVMVNLAPGATPPVIRLQSGFITSLVFLDRTGAPWPIQAIDIGDPRSFNVQWDKQSNTLLVQAITGYKTANLAVLLRELNTPVMITLIPGQKAVDYRVDLHVPGLGPNAIPTGDGLPLPASPLLLNVLSGIPPVGSKSLQVTPAGYADVWLWQGKLYVRSRATVLSPAWLSTMSSSDGTHAYKMAVAPLIIVSLNGKTINLNIEGY